jgi:hypothetical protein
LFSLSFLDLASVLLALLSRLVHRSLSATVQVIIIDIFMIVAGFIGAILKLD